MTIRGWTSSLNNDLNSSSLGNQGQDVMYNLYQAFSSSNNFTIRGDSNGTDSSMLSNRVITATTDFVWNNQQPGGPVSWFIVTNNSGTLPAGRQVYMLFACSGSDSGSMYSVISPSVFNTGSTTAVPSASSGVNRTFPNKRFIQSTVVAQRWHKITSSAGDILFTISRTGQSRYEYSLALLLAQDFESGDGYPFIFINSFMDGASGQIGSLMFGNNNTFMNATQSCMFYPNGTQTHQSGACGILNYYLTGTEGATFRQSALHAFGQQGSSIQGLYPDLPAILCSTDNAQTAIRGRLIDISVAPQGPSVIQGTVAPTTGSVQYAIYGHLWFPTSGNAPSI